VPVLRALAEVLNSLEAGVNKDLAEAWEEVKLLKKELDAQAEQAQVDELNRRELRRELRLTHASARAMRDALDRLRLIICASEGVAGWRKASEPVTPWESLAVVDALYKASDASAGQAILDKLNAMREALAPLAAVSDTYGEDLEDSYTSIVIWSGRSFGVEAKELRITLDDAWRAKRLIEED
jgi:hypothetical protein